MASINEEPALRRVSNIDFALHGFLGGDGKEGQDTFCSRKDLTEELGAPRVVIAHRPGSRDLNDVLVKGFDLFAKLAKQHPSNVVHMVASGLNFPSLLAKSSHLGLSDPFFRDLQRWPDAHRAACQASTSLFHLLRRPLVLITNTLVQPKGAVVEPVLDGLLFIERVIRIFLVVGCQRQIAERCSQVACMFFQSEPSISIQLRERLGFCGMMCSIVYALVSTCSRDSAFSNRSSTVRQMRRP